MFKKIFLLCGLALFVSVSAFAENEPVKKSKSNVCHAPNSKYYAKTKKFTPYKTMDECLKSGGHLPKK